MFEDVLEVGNGVEVALQIEQHHRPFESRLHFAGVSLHQLVERLQRSLPPAVVTQVDGRVEFAAKCCVRHFRTGLR